MVTTQVEHAASAEPRVDVVIPVLNEAHVLERSVATLRHFLAATVHHRWRVVIVDNGSTDDTDRLARTLASRHPDVVALHLDQRGRGRALRHAWTSSEAEVVCYMDVDLSTDLQGVPGLIAAVATEGFDVATGSRLLASSRVRRSLRRELISRAYNRFLRVALGVGFSDAQCGFKAVSRTVVERVVPHVQDQAWFFDTELLVRAERLGYRIRELPIVWVEDADSRVKILRTAWEDIKGVMRLRRQLGKTASSAMADGEGSSVSGQG